MDDHVPLQDIIGVDKKNPYFTIARNIDRLAIDENRWLSSATAFGALHDRRFNRHANRATTYN